jgi:hypothetical protein
MSTKLHGAVILGVVALVSVPVLAGLYFDRSLDHRAVDEVQERIYTTACVRYKKASEWERRTAPTFAKLAWCEKYVDRI